MFVQGSEVQNYTEWPNEYMEEKKNIVQNYLLFSTGLWRHNLDFLASQTYMHTYIHKSIAEINLVIRQMIVHYLKENPKLLLLSNISKLFLSLMF